MSFASPAASTSTSTSTSTTSTPSTSSCSPSWGHFLLLAPSGDVARFANSLTSASSCSPKLVIRFRAFAFCRCFCGPRRYEADCDSLWRNLECTSARRAYPKERGKASRWVQTVWLVSAARVRQANTGFQPADKARNPQHRLNANRQQQHNTTTSMTTTTTTTTTTTNKCIHIALSCSIWPMQTNAPKLQDYWQLRVYLCMFMSLVINGRNEC